MKHLATLYLLLLLAAPSYAQQKRIALVIGNAAYTTSPLKNPVNDANLMATTLKELGFEVTKLTNANLQKMQDAAVTFTENIENYDVALFYYAGHGIQVDGVNYLIPVDAKLETEARARYEAFNINDINEAFSKNSRKVNIMILDACRDNPFRTWMRGGDRGFIALRQQAAGTIIAFATREGSTAADGTGNNGVFTKELAQQMQKPQSLIDVFQNTRSAVLAQTDYKQVPQEWNMLTAPFWLTSTFQAGTVREGSLLIDTEVAGSLYVDGQYKAYLLANSQNNVVLNLMEGSHYVELRGSENLSQQVNILADQSIKITLKSTKKLFSPRLRSIPGGTFTMGSNTSDAESDETPHTVTVGSFEMMQHEVTVAEFKAFIAATGYQTDADKRTGDYGSRIWTGTTWEKKDNVNWTCDVKGNPRPASEDNHPVIHVSWNDAVAYANWLSEQTGRTWRLPTEAEWEYAAKGGETYTYAGSNDINAVAWYWDNASKTTHPVGQKKPNGYGLYDMTGNVWEWCSDWYSSDYYKSSPNDNPKGPATGSYRIIRGGAWSNNAVYCRASARLNSGPSNRSHDIGFRLLSSS